MSGKAKCVIALGYFDGVHKGHEKVLVKAKEIARKEGLNFAVFSFSGNLRSKLNRGENSYIYDKSERQAIYRNLGAEKVFLAPASKRFLSKDKVSFLKWINKKFDINAYVLGADYRFGFKGEGKADDLINFAKSNGQKVFVVDLEKNGQEKISSSMIKKFLSNGEVEKANEILSENYSITGKVKGGRKVGRTLGFPTVNIQIKKGRHRLKEGVYIGSVNLNDKEYKAIINDGARPTFNLKECVLEAHILNFSGNLYGKKIKIVFNRFLRPIKKFASKAELLEQIKLDKESVTNE